MLYRLADRLLRLKCYDNKMVELPGCSSVGASSCSWPTTTKKIVILSSPKIFAYPLTLPWWHYVIYKQPSSKEWSTKKGKLNYSDVIYGWPNYFKLKNGLIHRWRLSTCYNSYCRQPVCPGGHCTPVWSPNYTRTPICLFQVKCQMLVRIYKSWV